MITHQTRRQSYNNILKSLGTRQSQVFTELLCFPDGVTASELANEMHDIGFFRSSDRNNVHPRLNEMEEMGIVEIIGKRQCNITNKTVAVYKVNDVVLSIVKERLA
jgi:hypothetical protein